MSEVFQIEALLEEFESLGLKPQIIQSAPEQTYVQIDLDGGFPALITVRPQEGGFIEASLNCSVTPSIGERRADLEMLLSQIDDLIVPARIVLFGDEVGLCIFGGARSADDIKSLCIEFVLIARRLAASLLSPLVEFVEGKEAVEIAFARILMFLTHKTPGIQDNPA